MLVSAVFKRRKICEIDPLCCPKYSGEMKVIRFLTGHNFKKIVELWEYFTTLTWIILFVLLVKATVAYLCIFMVKQFSKIILLLIFTSSTLCSFGFGEPFTFNTQSNHQQVETSIDSHQDSFPGVIVGDYSDPLNLHFTFLPGEEWRSEEKNAKKKLETLRAYYSNGEQLTRHVNAPPFRSVPLSTCYLYHPPLYLLFEVFLL